MPGLYIRERKKPGEATRKPGVGPGDNGEPSPAAKLRLNEASRFYGKRVKNKKDGPGDVIFVSAEEPNKVTVLFDKTKETKKFIDMPGFPDPLQITGKIPKRSKNREAAPVEAAVAALA